ncbi:MAG: hypothetical protein Ct9H90mP11_10540 [Acidimicrobiales bacterium]|nr:MAG: hypothetical protein Ct9H90mP11_10540 [Acidimicrobiales bacterium]
MGRLDTQRTDSHLLESATQAGAKIFYETEALPNSVGEGNRSYLWSDTWSAELVVAASGAPGKVARMLGTERKTDKP